MRTLDGYEYTFNGLGEYYMITTTDGNFTLQGRTEQAIDVNGQPSFATVFTAFAATDALSDPVTVLMNAARTGQHLNLFSFVFKR